MNKKAVLILCFVVVLGLLGSGAAFAAMGFLPWVESNEEKSGSLVIEEAIQLPEHQRVQVTMDQEGNVPFEDVTITATTFQGSNRVERDISPKTIYFSNPYSGALQLQEPCWVPIGGADGSTPGIEGESLGEQTAPDLNAPRVRVIERTEISSLAGGGPAPIPIPSPIWGHVEAYVFDADSGSFLGSACWATLKAGQTARIELFAYIFHGAEATTFQFPINAVGRAVMPGVVIRGTPEAWAMPPGLSQTIWQGDIIVSRGDVQVEGLTLEPNNPAILEHMANFRLRTPGNLQAGPTIPAALENVAFSELDWTMAAWGIYRVKVLADVSHEAVGKTFSFSLSGPGLVLRDPVTRQPVAALGVAEGPQITMIKETPAEEEPQG